MKQTTTKNFCDRCKNEFEYSNGEIIHSLGYSIAGYDYRGSGGASFSNLEFCHKCTAQLNLWLSNKADFAKRTANPTNEQEIK